MQNNNSKSVLWISPQAVFPVKNGGQRGIHSPVLTLSKSVQCHFAFFHNLPDGELQQQVNHFSAYNIKTLSIRHNTDDTLQNLIVSIFRNRPLKYSKYHSKKHLLLIKNYIRKYDISTVVLSHAHLGWYARNIKKAFPNKTIILREHNIEYDIVRQYALIQNNFLKKYIIYWQHLLSKIDEQHTWRYIDKTIFISDSDLNLAKKYKYFHEIEWGIAYDGAETHESLYNTQAPDNHFLYSGALKLPQNGISFRFFIENYWKKYIVTHRDQHLNITSNSTEDICRCLACTPEQLAEINVHALGFVPNLSSVIANHTFVLSLTTIGSGIRVKIIEAMAQGALTLLTPFDFAMCRFFQDNYNVLTYSNYEEFSQKAAYFLDHPKAAEQIRAQAVADARLHFNWDYLIKQILET